MLKLLLRNLRTFNLEIDTYVPRFCKCITFLINGLINVVLRIGYLHIRMRKKEILLIQLNSNCRSRSYHNTYGWYKIIAILYYVNYILPLTTSTSTIPIRTSWTTTLEFCYMNRYQFFMCNSIDFDFM